MPSIPPDKQTKLYRIVNHESGDSCNGTHGRTLSVIFHSEAKVEVHSRNDMSENDVRKEVFTYDELIAQFDSARAARYFSDFCRELERAIPHAKAIRNKQTSWESYNDASLPASKTEIDTLCRQGLPKAASLKRVSIKFKA